MTKKKILSSAALFLAAVSSAFAQGNGLAGINDATNMVTSYFDPGTKLIYVFVVRGVYLPDRRRNDSALVLPVIRQPEKLWNTESTRESGRAWSSRG